MVIKTIVSHGNLLISQNYKNKMKRKIKFLERYIEFFVVSLNDLYTTSTNFFVYIREREDNIQ